MPSPNAGKCEKCGFWYPRNSLNFVINRHTGEEELLCVGCRVEKEVEYVRWRDKRNLISLFGGK